MVLKNNFFQIRSEQFSENILNVNVQIDETQEVFKGHFPDQPIVPGVFQLQIIKELLMHTFKTGLRLETSKEIKFIRPISPEVFKNLDVLIRIKDRTKEHITFSAQIKNSEAVFLKYRGIYKML